MEENYHDASTSTSFQTILLKPQGNVATDQAKFVKTNLIYSCSHSDTNTNQQD
jgi:hypothetical protein